MIISRFVRMKKRPEPKDKNSWGRKLVKGDRMNALHIDDCAAADVEMSWVGEINLIEVRRKVVSVIQPVEMVKIRLMEEGVSPTDQESADQRKKRKDVMSLAAQEAEGGGGRNIPSARSTHTEYMSTPRARKVPALITANLAVFAFRKTSMRRAIPGHQRTPRGCRAVVVPIPIPVCFFFTSSRWRSVPMTPMHDTP
jgi:hypothetical protein